MIENKNINTTASGDIVEKASGYWAANGKKILIALGVVLALIAGYLAYRNFVSEPNEQKAQEAMFRAQDYFAQDSVRLALNGDNVNPGFLRIISKYDGTKPANLAHFY